MHLENISLVNFRNYKESHFSFSGNINGILGYNGSGKTNLLDAIYYLSLTKSYFNSSDIQSIRFGSDYFALRGTFRKNSESATVTCRFHRAEKKEFILNECNYEKNTDHVGLFPVVMIAPNDTDIVRGGSELRRKFFDSVLAQTDRIYLAEILKYNQALKRRNSLLSQLGESRIPDHDLIDSYDYYLLDSGFKIFRYRTELLQRFIPVFLESYETIAGQKEKNEIRYLSDWEDHDFSSKFKSFRDQDILNRRTLRGIHKDEFDFLINGYPLRKFGSQGQQKSFLIALKLAQFELIRKANAFKPILLLDDIFDKLDEERIKKLISLVNRHNFGQIFITDARPERTHSILEEVNSEKKMIYLDNQVTVIPGVS